MKQDVCITVRGEQYDGEGSPDVTEQNVCGTLEKTDAGWTLAYEQADVRTTLEIGAERIVLTRRGSLNTKMVFQPGRTHTTLYELAFGSLTLEIRTHSVRSRLSERGGLIELRYAVSAQRGEMVQNHLKIRVKAAK